MMIEDIFEFGVGVLISFVYVYGMEWLTEPREMRGPPDVDLDDTK